MAKKVFFALLWFALAGLRQPVLAAGTGAGKSSQTSPSSSQKNLSDTQIEQAIRAKLAKSKMNADHFTVTVVKGVATIEGNTGVAQRKGAMTRMAKSCGAISVRNNIHVSDAARAKLTESLSRSGARGASGSSGTKGPGGDVSSLSDAPAPIPRAVVVRQSGSH